VRRPQSTSGQGIGIYAVAPLHVASVCSIGVRIRSNICALSSYHFESSSFRWLQNACSWTGACAISYRCCRMDMAHATTKPGHLRYVYLWGCERVSDPAFTDQTTTWLRGWSKSDRFADPVHLGSSSRGEMTACFWRGLCSSLRALVCGFVIQQSSDRNPAHSSRWRLRSSLQEQHFQNGLERDVLTCPRRCGSDEHSSAPPDDVQRIERRPRSGCRHAPTRRMRASAARRARSSPRAPACSRAGAAHAAGP